ncbi:MAG: PAS domain-containing protein [Gammaproteobacteria bacterium]|nr:PAS domain-containing protein [Gammaproteobacteria bacterium]
MHEGDPPTLPHLHSEPRLLRQLLDRLPVLVSYIDRDLRYGYSNAGHARLHGHAPADMQGRPVREIAGERAFEQILPHLRAALAGEELDIRIDLDLAGGGTRRLGINYLPVLDDDGRVQGVFALVEDLTSLRAAQRQVVDQAMARQQVASHARELALVADTLPELVAHLDTDGRLLYANRQSRRWLGADPEQLLGADLDSVPHPQVLRRALTIADGLDRPIQHHELVEDQRLADGSTIHYEADYIVDASADATATGDAAGGPNTGHAQTSPVRLLVVCRDITERHRAARAQEQAQRMLESIISQLKEGVSYYDEAGRLQVWNEAFEDIHRPIAHVLRQGVQFREVVAAAAPFRVAEGHASSEQDYIETRMAQHANPQGPLERRLADGRTIMLNETRTASGATIEVFVDVTLLAQREAQLAASNRELEQFAFSASHDLQAPLRNVNSFARLLDKRHRASLDEEGGEFLDFIIEGSARMQRLVSDLLTYARALSSPAAWQAVDANRVLEQILHSLRLDIERLQAQISSDPLPSLQFPTGQLYTVLSNLIGNALKYRSESLPIVHVSATSNEQQHQFSVDDNGMGILPENRAAVFEMFRRIEGARRSDGTGIGLALCKRIVESCGGRLWFESKPEGGTIFHFTVPATPPEQ